MWLVLSSSTDASAHWAYGGLRARGFAPLEMISAEALAYSQRWEHRLGSDGVGISLTLSDGRTISNGEVRGVLNRLTYVPTQHLFVTRDHDYMSQEFTAFFMSWLYALPQPVLNRPTPQGLCGPWRHVSEWVLLASQAGLPTLPFRQSSLDTINEMKVERKVFPAGTPIIQTITVGSHVSSPQKMPPEIDEGCRRLAAMTGTALLGVDFARTPAGAWAFAGATPVPDLRPGGEPLLDALATALRTNAQQEEEAAR